MQNEETDETNEYAQYIALLAAHYPDPAIEHYRPLQQGWDSVTLLVNETLVFRFARRPAVVAQLAREARLLPRLAEILPIAVPRFTYIGDVADGAGNSEQRAAQFVGYLLITGEPLPDVLDPVLASPIARQLAAFLTALHGFPLREAEQLAIPRGSANDWRGEYATFYDEIRQHAFPLLNEAERAQVAALWEGYLDDAANFTFAPALIHRDLSVEHILYDPATGRLTGVIDWGDACLGDPAQDFTALSAAYGPSFVTGVLLLYQHRLPIGDAATFQRRVRFYHDILPFHELRFGWATSDEEALARGLAALRRQLATA